MEAGGTPVDGSAAWLDPRWQWPEYDPGAVVELRIHGIGGEGPEKMTRDPDPVSVGGDAGVGFWRARNPVVRPPRRLPGQTVQTSGTRGPEGGPDGAHVREVVSWGGTTSGHGRSAFWVLLLPFALLNAAGRMAPPDSGTGQRTLHQALCRLLALSLTLAVVALFSGTMVDLVALQCAGQVDCVEADLAAGWLLTPLDVFALDAAALVAVAALVPVVAVYLLRVIGRRELTTVGRLRRPASLTATPAQLLDDPAFWHTQWPTWRLRGAHISAGYGWAALVLAGVLPPLLPGLPDWIGPSASGLAVLTLLGNAAVVAWPPTAAPRPDMHLGVLLMALRAVVLFALGSLVGTALAGQLTVLDTLGWQVAVVVASAYGAFWSLRELYRHAVTVRRRGEAPSGAVRDVVLLLSVLGLTAVLDIAGADRVPTVEALREITDPTAEGFLAGAPSAVYAPLWWLVAVQTLLVLLLVGTSAGPTDGAGSDERLWRSDRGPLPTAAIPGNLGAPVVALLSLLLVTAVGGGLQHAVLDWLGRRVATYGEIGIPIDGGAVRDTVTLALPWWKPWTAFVFVLTVVATGVALAVTLWAIKRTHPPFDAVERVLRRSLDERRVAPAPGPAPVDDQVPGLLRWADSRRGRVVTGAIGAALTGLLLYGIHRGMGELRPGWATTIAIVGVAVVLSMPVASWLRARHGRWFGTHTAPPSTIDRDGAVEQAARATVEATGAGWAHEALTRRSGTALLVAVAFATVFAVAGIAGVFGRPQQTQPFMATAWLWVTGLLPLGAVLLVRTAREDRSVRRNLGRVWDVLAFWPRLTHPFSPPSYGEALVPAVAARVEALRERGHPVILAGHSQGSVIALATALHLGAGPDVHVVTYGSPLRLLYEGFFPTVFGGDKGAIAVGTPDGHASPVTTWHNLTAFTEPIGTPLWHHSVRGNVPANPRTWEVLEALPWHDCPVCAWSRDRTRTIRTRSRSTDVTITDPDRLVNRAGELDGHPTGHSSYRRSREMDAHLVHLARQIRAGTWDPPDGPGPTDGVTSTSRS